MPRVENLYQEVKNHSNNHGTQNFTNQSSKYKIGLSERGS